MTPQSLIGRFTKQLMPLHGMLPPYRERRHSLIWDVLRSVTRNAAMSHMHRRRIAYLWFRGMVASSRKRSLHSASWRLTVQENLRKIGLLPHTNHERLLELGMLVQQDTRRLRPRKGAE